jgi:5-methylcytosine-specific restriction endonuclease McrA
LQRCAYCQSSESLTVVTFEVEHIYPLWLGGQTEFENLCLACPACNRRKANRVIGLTDEGTETRLFHSERDSWLDHFDWSVNDTVIVGLTDIGIATVNLLHMN